MSNNAYIVDAAIAGFIQGATNGRYLTDATAGDYSALATASLAFANAVDTAIPTDASLGSVSPATKYVVAHTTLCQSICAGVTAGRWNVDGTQADYNTLAAAVAALYSEAAANLV